MRESIFARYKSERLVTLVLSLLRCIGFLIFSTFYFFILSVIDLNYK